MTVSANTTTLVISETIDMIIALQSLLLFIPAASFPVKNLASHITFFYTVLIGSRQSQVQRKEKGHGCKTN